MPYRRGVLSTPHGTLGTQGTSIVRRAFACLSTPHGTLGTLLKDILKIATFVFQLHTVH